MLQLSLTVGTDIQDSVTSQRRRCNLGGEAEGQPIGRSPLGRPAAPRQGDRVGVADLGALPRFPEMSDAAASDTGERMEMAGCVCVCVQSDIGGVAAEGTAGWEQIKLRRWSRNSRVQAELKPLACCAAAGNIYLNSYPTNVCARAPKVALKHKLSLNFYNGK